MQVMHCHFRKGFREEYIKTCLFYASTNSVFCQKNSLCYSYKNHYSGKSPQEEVTHWSTESTFGGITGPVTIAGFRNNMIEFQIKAREVK